MAMKNYVSAFFYTYIRPIYINLHEMYPTWEFLLKNCDNILHLVVKPSRGKLYRHPGHALLHLTRPLFI